MFYIEDEKGQTKEQFLENYQIEMKYSPPQNFKEKDSLWCVLVHQGPFHLTLNIVDNQKLLEEYSSKWDTRSKTWHLVPINKLEKYMR